MENTNLFDGGMSSVKSNVNTKGRLTHTWVAAHTFGVQKQFCSDTNNGIQFFSTSATTPYVLRKAEHMPKTHIAPTRTRTICNPYPCGSLIKNGIHKPNPIFSAIPYR